jgi:hypothetical protein
VSGMTSEGEQTSADLQIWGKRPATLPSQEGEGGRRTSSRSGNFLCVLTQTDGRSRPFAPSSSSSVQALSRAAWIARSSVDRLALIWRGSTTSDFVKTGRTCRWEGSEARKIWSDGSSLWSSG